MKKELIIHLKAPLMSFGTAETTWDTLKGTATVPQKSTIIGMISAAFGYKRGDERIKELNKALNFKVLHNENTSCKSILDLKIEKNSILSDYQTVGTDRPDKWANSEDEKGFNVSHSTTGSDKDPFTYREVKGRLLINKEYLMDASFDVSVTGEEDLINSIYDALWYPIYPIYIGRKCCLPAEFLLELKEV